MVSDVSIFREFLHVFPEELPGVPPAIQFEVRILVPVVAPIAKSSHHLAPPKMDNLSSQLQELLGKHFIKPSSSR